MKTLIVGVGSAVLGDDGVGLHLVELLSERKLPTGVELTKLGTAGLALVEEVAGFDRVIIVDAIQSNRTPGTIVELDGVDIAQTAHLGAGHDADLPTALAWGRRVLKEKMPGQVTVFAVEAKEMKTFSEHLSDEVAAALPELVAKIEQSLR